MPTTPRLTNRQIDAMHAIAGQQEWIEDHGDNLYGYILRYGSASDPQHYGNGGEAIYAADRAYLDQLVAQYQALRGPR